MVIAHVIYHGEEQYRTFKSEDEMSGKQVHWARWVYCTERKEFLKHRYGEPTHHFTDAEITMLLLKCKH